MKEILPKHPIDLLLLACCSDLACFLDGRSAVAILVDLVSGKSTTGPAEHIGLWTVKTLGLDANAVTSGIFQLEEWAALCPQSAVQQSLLLIC